MADAKSDSETMQRKVKAKGDKQKMEKQQKLRLDHKWVLPSHDSSDSSYLAGFIYNSNSDSKKKNL